MAKDNCIILINNILRKLPNMNNPRKLLICEVMVLFRTIKGLINFLQPGRHGELASRQQFEKPFP